MPKRQTDPRWMEDFERTNRLIGARIRDARIEHDMTQSDLAQLLGRNKMWMSAVELGRFAISVFELGRIANILGAPLSWFLSDGQVAEKEWYVPETRAHWEMLYPGEPEKADSHWQVDRMFKKIEQAEKREKVMV